MLLPIPAFKALIGWPACPVSHSVVGDVGWRWGVSAVCAQKTIPTIQIVQVLSAASTAHSALWPLHAAPSGVTGLLLTSDKPCPTFSSLLCQTFCSLRNPTTTLIIHLFTK